MSDTRDEPGAVGALVAFVVFVVGIFLLLLAWTFEASD